MVYDYYMVKLLLMVIVWLVMKCVVGEYSYIIVFVMLCGLLSCVIGVVCISCVMLVWLFGWLVIVVFVMLLGYMVFM